MSASELFGNVVMIGMSLAAGVGVSCLCIGMIAATIRFLRHTWGSIRVEDAEKRQALRYRNRI